MEPKEEMTMEVKSRDLDNVTGCCGGPAPEASPEACCLNDAEAKAAGGNGCGCRPNPDAASAPGMIATSCCG